MRKRLIFILLSCLGSATPCFAQHHTDHEYAPSGAIFNNPERGFYKYTSRSSASGSLSKSMLEGYYDDGFTLIYRIYYMPDFVDGPISKAYLDKIREDFQVIREAGIKVVLRFAYTSRSTEPYGDATPEQVQEHIAQLKPLLQENADVIAVLQAGFIGAWGEWFYTDHFATGSPDNVTPADLEERADLLYSLLDALPASRQVQLRYVGYKMDFFGDDPISADEAYSGNAISRVAHHNDCFLSSSNDVGTYHSAYDRIYLQADSRYTAVGGETCRWYEYRSNCDTALVEMARYHWSFINIDYFGTTIQNWKDNGCFDDIRRKLGYRYELLSSSLQDSSRQNGSLNGSVQLANTGFSNPYNPRAIELVMRNQVTNKEYFLPLKTDIRMNPLGGEAFTLVFEGGIPPEAENGTYDLFLNLPDPMISLKNDPRYSIRLANEYTWEPLTGYNRLFHTLVIHPAASAPAYKGTDYFTGSDHHNMPLFRDISIDGSAGDWASLPSAFTSTPNQHANAVKVYNDNTFLYFLATGPALYPNSRLFIDTDNDPATGMNVQGWQTDGADYLVENSSLYAWSGTDGSTTWSWEYLDHIIAASGVSAVEIAVPLDLLDNHADTIRFGYQNGNSDFSTVEYLPDISDPLLDYVIDGFIDHAPGIYGTHFANNAILYWGIRENDTKYRIIERSAGNQDNFTVISVLSPGVVTCSDPGLAVGESYYYRSYLTDFLSVTSFTPVLSMVTGSETHRYSEITADGKADDWNAIQPILCSFNTVTYTLRVFADTRNINFLVTGPQLDGFELYLETDDNPSTGTGLLLWDTEGIDYQVRGDSLFHFQQDWQYTGKLSDYVFADSIIEFSLPFDDVLLGDRTNIRLGMILHCGSGSSYLPFNEQPLAVYDRVVPTGPPANFHLSSSAVDPASKIIISWDKCDNCDGHILEKSVGGPGSFEFLAELNYKAFQYIDDNLDNHSVYSYRMYSYNPAGKSDYTRVLTTSTHDLSIPDQDNPDRFLVISDQVSRRIIIRIIDPELDISSVALYDFSGRQVYAAGCQAGEREISIPVRDMNAGIYLLRLDHTDGVCSGKVIIH